MALTDIFAAIGVIALSVYGLRFANFLLQRVAPGASYAKYVGKWAVVTGASAGIGAGFAKALASRGVNVVLIARSEDKLRKVADECEAAGAKHSVQTKVVIFDFGNAGDADYERLSGMLLPLNPAILVNNVGVNVDFPTELVDIPAELVDSIVKVNITSLNKMTKMLLPGMKTAKSGLIYCLSSGGGAVGPGPLLTPYAGSKAYADAFAASLSGEVKDAGVIVHSLVPFFVESAMAKQRASFTVPKADVFASKALDAAGGPVRLSPHWPHAVMGYALTSIPHKLQIAQVTKLHRNIRKRALRRAERLAKSKDA